MQPANKITVYTTATIRNYVLFEMVFFLGGGGGGSNSLIYPHFSFMLFVNFDIKKYRTSHGNHCFYILKMITDPQKFYVI